MDIFGSTPINRSPMATKKGIFFFISPRQSSAFFAIDFQKACNCNYNTNGIKRLIKSGRRPEIAEPL